MKLYLYQWRMWQQLYLMMLWALLHLTQLRQLCNPTTLPLFLSWNIMYLPQFPVIKRRSPLGQSVWGWMLSIQTLKVQSQAAKDERSNCPISVSYTLKLWIV